MNLLKRHRMALGLTQHALGSRLGVTQACVHRWEAGRSEPAPKMFPKIAKVFGLTPMQATAVICPDGSQASAKE